MEDLINGCCGWCRTSKLYVAYHNRGWGRLVTDDKALFESLVLESSQARLSWVTIFRKREGYRKAFCDFDTERTAQMTDEDAEWLIRFEGIVENRQKIKSTVINVRPFPAVQKEFGCFYNYILLSFPDREPIINTFRLLSGIPVMSFESGAMSKNMKKRGFEFFRPAVCYAHLQASGSINGHPVDCVCKRG